jgi:hypothetical protein
MDFTNPIVLAAAAIAAFGGFFIGRLLTGGLIGGCLATVAGVIALVVVAKLLFGGKVGWVDELTANLGELVAGHALALIAFVAGFAFGVSRRRRA